MRMETPTFSNTHILTHTHTHKLTVKTLPCRSDTQSTKCMCAVNINQKPFDCISVIGSCTRVREQFRPKNKNENEIDITDKNVRNGDKRQKNRWNWGGGGWPGVSSASQR